MRGFIGLAVVAATSSAARADPVEDDATHAAPFVEDTASAERRLAPRNDSVYLSISQIHDDAVASRDFRISVGAPAFRVHGFGVGVFLRYAATRIESDQLLPEALVLHRFDVQLGGGGRLAPGWSFRGAFGVGYASDLHPHGLPGEALQGTAAAMVRHVFGPSDSGTIAMSTLTLMIVPKYEVRIAEWAVEAFPEMRDKLVGEGRVEGRAEEARSSLRHVLALRRFPLSAEEEARIDACGDLGTLRRWHDQAVVVASAAEALQ
jgi:hypothetical protein